MDHFKKRDTCCGAERRWSWHCCCARPCRRAAGVTAGGADQDTSARMLVPVGHTVGIKLFARGVMVVKAPESGTPADDCGLQTGDIIVKCGGVSVTSSETCRSAGKAGA